MDYRKKLLARPGDKIRLKDYDPGWHGPHADEKAAAEETARHLDRITRQQILLYGERKHSLLIVLQGIDAAGKDGACWHVISAMNPQGVTVTPFKVPTPEEHAHDFLWRVHPHAPALGRVAVFNRSHYESVLVERVHSLVPKSVWSKRYDAINAFEDLLQRSGATILKFFLWISPEEQLKRFGERLEDPARQWKISDSDYSERALWDDYIAAFEAILRKCSTERAPWFVIPSNHKWFRNLAVSQIIAATLEDLKMRTPAPTVDLAQIRAAYQAAARDPAHPGKGLMDLTLAIFVLVYVAMGFGHLPGFKVDRTGAAVVGAMALIALGRITPAAAWAAIDYRTIGLLFGLMVVSSAFVVAGFYDRAARWVGDLRVSPPALLAVLIGVAGGLSALLTNDVVVVAMTPVLVSITLARGLNPAPFLLGFCFAANTGSAATLIGSPQNMIAAEALRLSFTGFLRVAALPALVSLPIVWLTLALLYRGRWTAPRPALATGAGGATMGAASPALSDSAPRDPAPTGSGGRDSGPTDSGPTDSGPTDSGPTDSGPTDSGQTGAASAAIPFDRLETLKAGLVTLAVVAAFVLTDWPHMLVALAGAAVLLVNRSIASRDMLGRVDGDLLLLLMGLFVVNAAVAATGLPQRLLAGLDGVGLDLQDPLSMLAAMSVLSNIVGNNPAVMLAAPFLDGAARPEALGAAIALGTGFSSNLVIFGSLAGIIVAEQGRAHGVEIGFREFSRAGVPAALLCLALAAGWILYLGA